MLIEAVEPRRLLAASLNGNVLQITGTSGADAYTVKLNGTNLVVQRAGEAAQSFAKSAVAKIVANLGNGNDSILIDDNVNTPASLSGEAGNDTLRGGTGRDTIDGGSGWDTVTYAGRAAAISASVKMTIVHDYNPTTDVYVNYPNGNGTGGTGSEADSYRGIETIVGGAGNDTLTLSGDAPYYPGGGPTLSWTPLRGEGGGGNDQFKINSGFTSDEAARIITIVADGGDGNDSFDFGDNRDPWISVSLYGGAGNDSFHGTTFDGGYSLIDGGAGTDLLTFHSLSRKDYTLPTGVENFTFNNDGTGLTITGNGLDNVITINGNPTGSTVRGGGGNDTIRVLGTGFGGNNAFYGEAGNDTIIGSAYDDLIDGGDGLDTVSYAGRAAPISANVTMTVTFDYDPETDARTYIFDGNGTGGSGDEGDTYRFIEAIVGGAGNDSITLRDDVYYYDGMRPEEPIVVLRGEGGGGDDLFWVSTGTRGRDAARGVVGIVADGGVGNDSFGYSNDGGPGATLIGGDGDDTFSKGNDDATVSSIVAGAGTDTWQMYSGAYRAYVMAPGLENFVATGSFSNGVVWGNELDNTITVGAGGTVRGFGGNDRITITDGTATSFVYGDAGNDTIIGGNGRDEISGGDGDDSLAGNAGDDALYGDAGNDRLDPGTGNDSVAGGAGGAIRSSTLRAASRSPPRSSVP